MASGDAVAGRFRIVDAQDSSLSMQVYNTRAARVSGDVVSNPQRTQSGTFGNVQVTTTATRIIAGNPSRIAAVIQNVDEQQIALGFTNAVTVSTGVFIAPIGAGSSGDGGVFSVTNYVGDIWGITASGDASCRYMEV